MPTDYREGMDMFMAEIERDAGNIVLKTYFPWSMNDLLHLLTKLY